MKNIMSFLEYFVFIIKINTLEKINHQINKITEWATQGTLSYLFSWECYR